MKPILRLGWMFGLIILVMPFASSSFGVERDKHRDRPALVGPPYWARVTQESDCCPKIVELRVREEGTEEERSLELSGRMSTLEELRPAVAPRALLIGGLRYGGTALWVVNLESLEREAEIWTYGYGLSPSRRFLAYQTHYPPRALPDGRRSIFLLYDLAAPPEHNRPGAPSDWPKPNLGIPIFPEANALGPSWDVSKADHVYSLSSPFLWSDNEQELVFVLVGRLPGSEQRSSFVARVRLSPDGQVTNVISAALSPENVEAPFKTVSLEELQSSPLLVTLESLRWAEDRGEGWVAGETALPGDELGRKVWIRLPPLEGQASTEPRASTRGGS